MTDIPLETKMLLYVLNNCLTDKMYFTQKIMEPHLFKLIWEDYHSPTFEEYRLYCFYIDFKLKRLRLDYYKGPDYNNLTNFGFGLNLIDKTSYDWKASKIDPTLETISEEVLNYARLKLIGQVVIRTLCLYMELHYYVN